MTASLIMVLVEALGIGASVFFIYRAGAKSQLSDDTNQVVKEQADEIEQAGKVIGGLSDGSWVKQLRDKANR